MYNYKEAVKKDVWEWLADDDGFCFNRSEYIKNGEWDKERMIKDLDNMLCQNDRITGFWTGYDMPEDCKEYLEGNEDLAFEAMETAYSDDFAYDEMYNEGEYVNIDTNVRMFLLPDVIREVVEELPKPEPEYDDVLSEAYELLDEAVNEVFRKLKDKYGIKNSKCPAEIMTQGNGKMTELSELVAKTILFEFGR